MSNAGLIPMSKGRYRLNARLDAADHRLSALLDTIKFSD